MNILLITNLYPNPLEPNRGIFTSQLVEKLSTVCEVTVMSPVPWFPKWSLLSGLKQWYKFAQVPDRAVLKNIEVIYPKYIVIPKLFGFLQSATLYLSLVFKIAKLNRRKKIDVINAQWMYPDGVAATYAAKTLGIPVVVSALGCDINLYATTAYPVRRFQIMNTLRTAEQSIAISSAQSKVMSEDLGADARKLSIVLNGVNQDLFRIQNRDECVRKFSLDPANQYILYVGRLSDEKGIIPLLKAIGILHKENLDPRVKLLVIGNGELWDECQALANALGITDRVIFKGERPYSEIVDWMGAATLHCLPSYREGCPNVVLEALASGRPVIATRVGSVPEVLRESNGVIAEPGDESSIAAAIKKGLQTSWNEQDIRASVKDFTWQKMADRYKSIFEAALH